jgi:hypothetical protein
MRDEVFMAVKNSWFSGPVRRVEWWLDTNVSEDHAASIFRVEYQGNAVLRNASIKKTRLDGTKNQKTTISKYRNSDS